MSDHRGRRRGLISEQAEERFSTDGASFEKALALVLAGGTDKEHTDASDEREASK